MDVWTVLVSIAGSAVAGPAAVFVSRYLGDRSLEALKVRHSKELAKLAHDRSVLLTEMQNAFSMGASSHMATVAFDKHIGFCEAYIRAVSLALRNVIQPGASAKPLDVTPLFGIRQKWSLWLTDELERKLDLFELGIGAAGAQVFDERGVTLPNDRSIKSLVATLGHLLATEELTDLRSELVHSLGKTPRPAG